MRPVFIVVITSLALLIAGCGGNSSTPTPPQVQQLALTSGNWDFVAASSSDPSFLIGGNIVQTGTSVTGGLHVANSACITRATPVPITGNISGQTATVTSASVASQTINASLSGSATALTGTYTIAGTGCAGGDKGNIAGVLVPSISGTWKGTLISNTVANPGVGVTAPIVEGARSHRAFCHHRLPRPMSARLVLLQEPQPQPLAAPWPDAPLTCFLRMTMAAPWSSSASLTIPLRPHRWRALISLPAAFAQDISNGTPTKQ